MSNDDAIEAARQRLIREPYQSPTRVLGYANRHILRIDHRPGHRPDAIIHEFDPTARRLLTPPTEDHPHAPDDRPEAETPIDIVPSG